jgi:hypothetical protein
MARERPKKLEGSLSPGDTASVYSDRYGVGNPSAAKAPR